jgi:hypothetical protein
VLPMRQLLFSRALLNMSVQAPGKIALLHVPNRKPCGEKCPFRSLLLYLSRSPQQTMSPYEKHLTFVVKSPLMEPPLFSNNGPAIEADSYFKILLLHILQISQ